MNTKIFNKLWRMYSDAARNPTVIEELERLFPNDINQQRLYRDAIVDKDRKNRKHVFTR